MEVRVTQCPQCCKPPSVFCTLRVLQEKTMNFNSVKFYCFGLCEISWTTSLSFTFSLSYCGLSWWGKSTKGLPSAMGMGTLGSHYSLFLLASTLWFSLKLRSSCLTRSDHIGVILASVLLIWLVARTSYPAKATWRLKGRFILPCNLEGIVHHGKKAMVVGAWSGQSHPIHSHKAELWMPLFT